METFFGRGALGTSAAYLAALLIGLAFGFALERAGFGSSRRLAGIFYFRDMTVLKVMFSAVITAMLGLVACRTIGVIGDEQLYFMPSIFGAQLIGGILFGIGFVAGGWCPGTAAVGLASGKLDALIFLGGGALGSILFNEVFSTVAPLQAWGDSGVRFAWQDLGLSHGAFALIFTLVAIGCFWGAEAIERRSGGGTYWKSPFLKTFSLALVIIAFSLAIIPVAPESATAPGGSETALLASVEAGEDHMEPEELADRLMAGDPNLLLIDVRTPGEYAASHIRGAVNVGIADLVAFLQAYPDRTVVLYSTGMTHPAQARDALARLGRRSVFILTDGIVGFFERVLKPVSLRGEPVPDAIAARIRAWRAFFLGGAPAAATVAPKPVAKIDGLPGLLATDWLAENLDRADLRIIDVRPQPAYNTSHIPGSVCLNPESFRGVAGGVSSMLLPDDILARHLSLLGLTRGTTVAIVPSGKLQDATLIAIGIERAGHRRYGVLDGGFEKWAAEKRPLATALPEIAATDYPVDPSADRFTVDYRTVLAHVKARDAVIIDVRPADAFSGEKSDEARAGHIPGAVNRPFTEDIVSVDGITRFKPVEELAKAYAAIIPSKDARVIVHCRTGHQASQTFFVLRHLLSAGGEGYANVLWYDAGWSEWAARPELPVAR
ncbi:MAG: YeeE/YedE family protein [Planctomycetes bacterium]|nr:YeeE/YedE family protein [Planctomycetota bacterium]